MAMRSAVAFVALLLVGCAEVPSPMVISLPVPPMPVLPTVSAEEAERIDGAVWERIASRDILLRGALNECHAILESTHPVAP